MYVWENCLTSSDPIKTFSVGSNGKLFFWVCACEPFLSNKLSQILIPEDKIWRLVYISVIKVIIPGNWASSCKWDVLFTVSCLVEWHVRWGTVSQQVWCLISCQIVCGLLCLHIHLCLDKTWNTLNTSTATTLWGPHSGLQGSCANKGLTGS